MKTYLNKLYGRCKLFKEFISSTTLYQYREWQNNDNKPLWIYFIEWFSDNVVHYIIIGLLLALAFVTDGFIGYWMKGAVGYYFLKRMLLVVRVGK